MARPLSPVTAPPAAPPRFGLLASIPPVTGQGERWTGGITYTPEGCNDGELFDLCEFGTETEALTNPADVQWWPYVISATVTCSTFSGVMDEDRQRAERLLQQQTETLIGREFWEGTFAQLDADNPNSWLANPDSDNLSSGGAVTLTHALACLEQYLSENNGGRQGAIHATAQVVTHWESFRLLRREGNRILTFKDTVVIPSPGYTGTSPEGDIGDNNIWAYATDMPRIWLSDIAVTGGMDMADRSSNTTYATAQRTALVEWEKCRHAAVQLEVEMCDSGGS